MHAPSSPHGGHALVEDITHSSPQRGNMNTREKGTYYEEAAAAYIEDRGITIVDRNVRCGRIGEIDIIGRDADTLIFFEVKYRKDHRHGYPEEAVDRRKQNRLRSCARYYLAYRHMDAYVRFDVIAVEDEQITWYKNAF